MSLQDVLRQHGFTFSKKYGQNFISDPQLLAAIARDGAEEGDFVLEIGAGAGTLTHALAQAGARVTAFEIDKRLEPVLRAALEGTTANVIFADALSYDMESVLTEPYRIVANLPYYITTPVIFRFLYDANLKSLTVMVQKEVAERICAKPATPAYGALSAQMQLMGTPRITRTVPRNMFTPAPQVDSAVVRLDISPKCDRERLPRIKRVIAAAFAMRRKTLANNLCAAFALGKPDAEAVVAEVTGSSTARGETLSVEQFMQLEELLSGIKNEE
ncbi:MAG: 16S rRNA (adenine(1518)-N(6)/adenine(1519)-N(6))-dimethyltransferase RsmA [Clostridiales bacterium]|nr:16S rRNA (adenine(1518)-N(6)/adenine(1519)-N(6))-dimethyltransferase RsmA [Clostridiales bacterium]